MKLSVKEVIEKIESGELGWNDIEDLEITDPENLDELKTYAKNNSTGEKSKKIRMNSLYGALDNESFPLHNRNISGSITLIGRFSIQYTSKLVQELLEKMFGPGNYIIYNDTDSCESSTKLNLVGLYKVTLNNGVTYIDEEHLETMNMDKAEHITQITIGELFEIAKQQAKEIIETKPGKYVIPMPFKLTTPSVNKDLELEWKPIVYIMKHKTEKTLYKITIKDKEIIVTEDHSCMVIRDGKLIEIEPKNIKAGDKFVLLENGKLSITEKFTIENLGTTEEDVYDIEVQDNHNFFGNDILVHNSGYFTLAPLVNKILEKKSKSYNELTPEDKKEIIETLLKFIQKKIEPLLDDLFHIFEDEFNFYTRGFFGFKVEKIAEKGIFVAKKRYALKPIWSEGSYFLDKAKLAVTGLDIVRSSTPDFVIDKLSEALIILMDKDESAIRNYVDRVKKEFFEIADKHPESIAKTSGVSSLNYQLDEKGWCRYTPEGRRIPAPINSRAAILHNKLIKEKNLTDTYEPIAEGDKIKFVMLTLPNPIGENVFGFKDEKVLFDTGLIKYLDKEQMFETNFLQPLKLILEVLNIDLSKKAIDFDGW